VLVFACIAACGEPPLVLAGSVHSAVRRAIEAARFEAHGKGRCFQLNTPATMEVVRTLCGLSNIEEFLELARRSQSTGECVEKFDP
jgi:xanthine dehydrogenase molybdopterin-binding subunit B